MNVAMGIADGRHLAEIAADRCIKIETVRTHSKTVFHKTGTRGQPKLAALLTAWPSLVPRRRDRATWGQGDFGRN
jgi:DNA-binding CsgD family transcriptional regulator